MHWVLAVLPRWKQSIWIDTADVGIAIAKVCRYRNTLLPSAAVPYSLLLLPPGCSAPQTYVPLWAKRATTVLPALSPLEVYGSISERQQSFWDLKKNTFSYIVWGILYKKLWRSDVRWGPTVLWNSTARSGHPSSKFCCMHPIVFCWYHLDVLHPKLIFPSEPREKPP